MLWVTPEIYPRGRDPCPGDRAILRLCGYPIEKEDAVNTLRRSGLILGALLLAAAVGADGNDNPAWEKMKTLVGDWSGDSPEGKVQISYKLVSSGKALMESIREPGGSDMVSLYHPDGSRLVMTHYCSAGNQPRMRAAGLSEGGKKLAFSYLDATNLASPDEMHMVRLVVTFDDADHLTQEWTERAKGKDNTAAFQLTRKKP
jgi:hypothetical protein